MRILSLSVMLLAVPVYAEDKVDVAKAVEQAQALTKAAMDGEFGKLVDATHPKLVEIMGGREKLIAEIKGIMAKLKDQMVVIKSHSVGKPGAPVIDGGTAYLVVPTTLELTSDGMKIVTENYLLGMTTDGGKKWVFADGAGIALPEVRDKVFPKLPEGLKLPEIKPPTVTKD